MTPADLDRLRAQLVDMRDGLVERLVQRVEGGDLALLASVGAALRTIDDIMEDEAECRK